MKAKEPVISESRWDNKTDNGERVKVGWIPRFLMRKTTREAALPLVRAEVLSRKDNVSVTVEEIATVLRVATHKVHWAFMVLNRDGILEQQANSSPHNSPRDTRESGSQSAWLATRYYFKRQATDVTIKRDEVTTPIVSPKGTCGVAYEEIAPRKKRFSKRMQGRME